MFAKRIFQLIVVVAILVTSFASTGGALAWTGCANYITVQWGDTLSGIAATCGTTMDAIQAANPGLGWWLYAGQVLYIPTGYAPAPAPVYYPAQTVGSTYVVQWGDTLSNIAVKTGFSVSSILAVNPQIWNVSLIYIGQVINLPAVINPVPAPYYPPVPAVSAYGNLKVTYGHGLLVRTGPGKNYAEIQSPFVSAMKETTWQYNKGSLTIDPNGYVWVEVKLNPLAPYSTGWMLVRDTLGNYFTDPHIDP